MFESTASVTTASAVGAEAAVVSADPGAPPTDETAILTTAALAGWTKALAQLNADVDDAERIDQLRALEELKSACAAAQAKVTAAFAASQRTAQRAAGLPAREVGTGIGAQVALARRDSRSKGGRHLGLAEALVHEMPRTLAALERGLVSEWRATLVARETACLTSADRRRVDAELADRLPGLGDQQTAAQARRLAYQLDPHGFMSRVRGATEHRRVTIRPAPDTMALVTGLVPVAQGVAVHAALARTADTLRAQGDSRSRGQIMADEFVTRLTGQTSPDSVPVQVQLVMTDRTLLDDHPEAAQLTGHGPIPAPLARKLLVDADAQAWLRRLFIRPADHTLLTMDSRRRSFPVGLQDFLRTRDQICRTPWCDAPIRHTDHVTAAADGGSTSLDNGQGLCEACNYTKRAPGWTSQTADHHTIHVTTPTGHRYASHPPPLPGTPTRASPIASTLEARLEALLDAA